MPLCPGEWERMSKKKKRWPKGHQSWAFYYYTSSSSSSSSLLPLYWSSLAAQIKSELKQIFTFQATLTFTAKIFLFNKNEVIITLTMANSSEYLSKSILSKKLKTETGSSSKASSTSSSVSSSLLLSLKPWSSLIIWSKVRRN